MDNNRYQTLTKCGHVLAVLFLFLAAGYFSPASPLTPRHVLAQDREEKADYFQEDSYGNYILTDGLVYLKPIDSSEFLMIKKAEEDEVDQVIPEEPAEPDKAPAPFVEFEAAVSIEPEEEYSAPDGAYAEESEDTVADEPAFDSLARVSEELVPLNLDETPDAEDRKPKQHVEINGDIVEYSVDRNKMTAEGDVVVVNKDMKLYCDRIEFDRLTNMGYATGNVRLVMKQGEASEMTGEKLTFDFTTMKGTFADAKLFAAPYFGFGKEVTKVEDNHMRMKENYITTCDHDKPHYRIKSKKMDVYPGEKLIARGVRMFIANLPVLYIPKITQDLSKKKPIVTFIPGRDKDWGMFLLTQWRYQINENLKGVVHLDAREKRDLAWGFDVNYKTPSTGEGKIRTYYMNERKLDVGYFFEERESPTIERERFRVEWRHKWEIDESTNAIMQYSKQSDSSFLKEYFEREFDEDFSPETYFLTTKAMKYGFMSFRTDVRVNRFETKVERLPELRYDLSNLEIFDTGLFFKNQTIYSNLTNKNASPSEARTNTMRVHTDNELSYPMKISFIEMRPFVGGINTLYSKTKDPDAYGSLRGLYKTGASLSAKFYRIFDTHTKKLGLDINRLRHVITPSVSYLFRNYPSLNPDQIDFFDNIDRLDISHNLSFALENKLQTKWDNANHDLVRALISSDFHLKEDAAKAGFDDIRVDIDVKPTPWIDFFFDSTYDTQEDHLSTANFDLYINGGSKWQLNIGKRWSREVDDQLTSQVKYNINPKWALLTYSRFDLRSGILKEQEYTVRRDLHAWYVDINFNETRSQGDEIWIVFTLKAFPDLVVDFGTGFNKRKAGSQSSEGD